MIITQRARSGTHSASLELDSATAEPGLLLPPFLLKSGASSLILGPIIFGLGGAKVPTLFLLSASEGLGFNRWRAAGCVLGGKKTG